MKNKFKSWKITSITGNLNMLADRNLVKMSDRKSKNGTWGKSCENICKYFLTEIKQCKPKNFNFWSFSAISICSELNKVALKKVSAWSIKEYTILSVFNLCFKPIREFDNLWKTKVHFETSRINFLGNYGSFNQDKSPVSWKESFRKNYLRLLRMNDSNSKRSTNFSNWQWSYRQTYRWFNSFTDTWNTTFVRIRKKIK